MSIHGPHVGHDTMLGLERRASLILSSSRVVAPIIKPPEAFHPRESSDPISPVICFDPPIFVNIVL